MALALRHLAPLSVNTLPLPAGSGGSGWEGFLLVTIGSLNARLKPQASSVNSLPLPAIEFINLGVGAILSRKAVTDTDAQLCQNGPDLG